MPDRIEDGSLAVLVGCDPDESTVLARSLSPRLQTLAAPPELRAAIGVEDAAEAREAVLDWLGDRRLGAGVVAVSPEQRGRIHAASPDQVLDSVVPALREAFLWARALGAAMAERDGGLLLLPIFLGPVPGLAAGTLESGLIGLAKTTSVSLVGRGVRCLALRRVDDDGELFARLVSVLATPELHWLSGHLLAADSTDVVLFTPDEPLWELFATPALTPQWLERTESLLLEGTGGTGRAST